MINYQMLICQMQHQQQVQSKLLELYITQYSQYFQTKNRSISLVLLNTELTSFDKKQYWGMIEAEQGWVVDEYFIKCYHILRDRVQRNLIFLSIRTIFLLPITLLNRVVLEEDTKTHSNLFQTFLTLSLIYNICELSYRGFFYWFALLNKSKVYQIAHGMHHAIREEELQEQNGALRIRLDDSGLQVSSTLYDFENMEHHQEVSQELKIGRQGNGAILLSMTMEGFFGKVVDGLLGLASLGLFVLGIVAASKDPPITETQHTVLELVLLSQVLFKPKVYVICVLFVVVPVLVILFVLCICCCKRRQPEAKLPQPIEATPQILANCAQCSICFQSMGVGSKVIMLPCSPMHVFDQTCIKGWTKVKANCPICRFDLV